jgi:hypothetical protein
VDTFLEDARWLAGRTWVGAVAVLLPVAGFAAGGVPLLDAPGYELGMAGAWIAVALAAPLGIAAARHERRRPVPSPAAAAAATATVLVALLALLLAGNALRAVAGPCRALAAVGLFPLLAVPSAILGSAVAAAAGFVARRRSRAVLLYAGVVLASLAATLRAAYAGPQAFLLDPFLGWWPGPLYDEALRADPRVVLARLAAALGGIAVAAAAELVLRAARRGGGALARLRAAAGPAIALAAAAGAIVATHAATAALGLAPERTAIARQLGGVREGAACTIHYPGEKPAAAARGLLAQCELDAADVARALGLERPPRVTVWVYRSAEEKRRLVGAEGTNYTKPWIPEIHLNDAPLPQPVLRHELVHAIAGALAAGPLRVPARALVFVRPGLVEGLAVALEVPRGPWTIHQWARALRDEGRLPDPEALLSPAGFLGAAPARAYTAAGSFLRFLLERYGAERVAALYRSGDLAGALGVPAHEAAEAWQRFLDGVEVPGPLAAAAHARFARGSLFARRCVREAASLAVEASDAAARGRGAEAAACLRRAAELGGGASELRAAGDALARSGDLEGAARAYREALAVAGEADTALRSTVLSAQGDLAWRRGAPGEAAARYGEALALGPERAEARLLEAKLAALSDPDLAAAARGWLLGEGDGALALARVAQAPAPLASYLVGRAAAARGEAALAAEALGRAAAGRLPDAIALEARFLLGEARCAAGDATGGAAVLEPLAREAEEGGDRERAAAGLRQCAPSAAQAVAGRGGGS